MQINQYHGFISSHKQGHLTATRTDVTKVLGFEPQEDLCEKVTMLWDFEIDGKLFSIWDYKGKQFSIFGDMDTFKTLFGANNVEVQ